MIAVQIIRTISLSLTGIWLALKDLIFDFCYFMVAVPWVIQAWYTVCKARSTLNIISILYFIRVILLHLLRKSYYLGEPFFALKQTFSLFIKIVGLTISFQTELAWCFRWWGASTTNWARKANMSMVIGISPIRALESFYWWLCIIWVEKINKIITSDRYSIIFVFLNSEFIH